MIFGTSSDMIFAISFHIFQMKRLSDLSCGLQYTLTFDLSVQNSPDILSDTCPDTYSKLWHEMRSNQQMLHILLFFDFMWHTMWAQFHPACDMYSVFCTFLFTYMLTWNWMFHLTSFDILVCILVYGNALVCMYTFRSFRKEYEGKE